MRILKTKEGALRDPNTIHILNGGQCRAAHLGDLTGDGMPTISSGEQISRTAGKTARMMGLLSQ